MPAMSFLRQMAEASWERVAAGLVTTSEAQMIDRALATPPPPALKLSSFDVIAEIKRRSPAAGTLAQSDFSFTQQLDAYRMGGATAISILTEPTAFEGDLSHLQQAASHLPDTPIMRKDFLVAPYQVYEARAAGAAGILVIVGMLDDPDIEALLEAADRCALFTLVEAFDGDELDRGSRILRRFRPKQPTMLGVNCRNLKSLTVDFQRFDEFSGRLPRDFAVVAESGLASEADAAHVARLGFRGALVGSALMANDDAGQTLAKLVAAGRKAVDP